jgi:positive regulator of sigma E activity
MKKLLLFYVAILVPLLLIYWFSTLDQSKSWLIVGLIIFYALIYRTYIDGMRLVEKQVLAKSEIWKVMIPGTRIRYFRELYLL